jgi:hypothetical protein
MPGWSQATGRTQPADVRREEVAVDGREMCHFGRQPKVFVDGLRGAGGHANAAVDAFIRVNVQSALAFVDAIDRTALDASAVLDVDAGAGDDVGHGTYLR